MTTNEMKEKRTAQFVKAFRTIESDSPLADFENKTGYNRGNLSKILSGQLYASKNVVKLLEDNYNIRIEDYNVNDDDVKEKVSNSGGPLLTRDNGVPFYDVDFHGGFDIVMNDQTVSPSYYIDFPPYNHADAWINVTGKSMSPFISHGDIAALKLLKNWRTWIPPGEVYAIYTDEHRTIKIVSPGKDDDHFLLKSYNNSPEFVDSQIPKGIIKGMFRVLGSIKKFF